MKSMCTKLAVAVIGLATVSCLAQVVPSASGHKVTLPINWSLGGGMDYWAGDYKDPGEIHRWGPSAWATATIGHCLGINLEGHSMTVGGDQNKSNYKLFIGEGGLICTMGYWGRFQPIYKGEVGLASLTQPGSVGGHSHSIYRSWSIGGGAEYHTAKHWWTRVEFTYETIPNFYSTISNQRHSLNPRGITFGETYRFGESGTRF